MTTNESHKDVSSCLDKVNRQISLLTELVRALQNPPAGGVRPLISRIAVEGRAVTNILQGLRNIVDGFDDWYQPYVDQMRRDPLLRYFYQLRTDTLKKGDDHINSKGISIGSPRQSLRITAKGIEYHANFPNGTIKSGVFPKPKNCIGTFLGDSEGGAGFLILGPRGKKIKQYIDVPGSLFVPAFEFRDPPTTHLDKSIKGSGVKELCSLYVAYLEKLTYEAEIRFRPKQLDFLTER